MKLKENKFLSMHKCYIIMLEQTVWNNRGSTVDLIRDSGGEVVS